MILFLMYHFEWVDQREKQGNNMGIGTKLEVDKGKVGSRLVAWGSQSTSQEVWTGPVASYIWARESPIGSSLSISPI